MTSKAPVVETARRPVIAQPAASWRESLEAFIRGLLPVPRFAMTVAMVVLLGGSVSLVTETLRLRSQLNQMRAENQSRQDFASLTLLPGISRGGGQKARLVVPENARLVRLHIGIEPEEPYKTYAVELRTVSGRPVWNRENLLARDRRGARAIELTLPVTVIKPGDYELRLKGVAEGGNTEDVGFYYFTATKN